MRDIAPIPVAVGLLMAGATIGAASIGRSIDCTDLGLLLCIAGIAWLVVHRITTVVREVNRPADDAYSEGWESGYDRGYREGQQAPLPTVVQFPTRTVTVAPPVAASGDSAGN